MGPFSSISSGRTVIAMIVSVTLESPSATIRMAAAGTTIQLSPATGWSPGKSNRQVSPPNRAVIQRRTVM